MFKDTFCHSGLHNRIMFCLMGSLRDSDHLRSTLVVYQRSGTSHREMTRGCWWSMFMWLIWVMSLHVYLKCTSHPGCSSVFLAFAWLEQWSSLNIQRGCCLIRWHHEAAAAVRQVMLWQTKFKKPLKKCTVATSGTHESIWRWRVFFLNC